MSDIIKKASKKQVRLGLFWNNYFINFCTIGFTTDNTLIFTSKFHNQEGSLEIGTSKILDGQAVEHQPTNSYKIKKGCHISLHPREQIMHVRENPKGRVLSEKIFNWFPVQKPFHLLSLHSPPLDKCITSNKRTPFLAPAPTNYRDSVLLKVDIFPRRTEQHFPYNNCIWVFWGYCPEYFARVSFILTMKRTPAIIYWPVDDGLLTNSHNEVKS